MSRQPLNWGHAPEYRTSGKGTVIEKTTQRPDYILTQRQREAVKAFADGSKEEIDAKALVLKARMKQEMAVALLHSYGTKPKQICQLTGLRPGQIQSYLEHGRIHLGIEE